MTSPDNKAVVEQQQGFLDYLRGILQHTEAAYRKTKALVEDNEGILKDLCGKAGHQWQLERDNDCHSPSTISVCRCCGSWCYGDMTLSSSG